MTSHKDWLKAAKIIETEGSGALENIPKPWMLIDGLLPQGAVCVLAGRGYSGKTFLAMEAARAIVTGQPFLGHYKVPSFSRGNVLFIEQDSPKYDTGNAIWAMIKEQWKAEKTDLEVQHPLEGLRIAWHPGLNLMQRLDAYRIAKTANSLFTHLNNVVEDELIFSEEGDVIGRRPTGDIEEEGYRGAKLIILDTLRALNTGKEDKSDDMEPIVQNLKLIRHLTGATILLIHHTGAGDERTRGSTAVEDGADFTMYVKGRKGKAKVEIRKARAVQPLDFKFEITSQENPTLGPTKQVVFRGEMEEQDSDDEAPNQLTEYLKKQGEVSREQLLEWSALNGMSRATLDRRLKELAIAVRHEGKRVFYKFSA